MEPKTDVSEDQLIQLAKSGDESAINTLFEKYDQMIRSLARRYFFAGGDRDDVLQEACIGFWKAIRNFRQEKGVEFFWFARMCIRRQIITSIKKANRKKNWALNHGISLSKPLFNSEGEGISLEQILSCDAFNPEEQVIANERKRELMERLRELSDLEYKTIILWATGWSYEKIAGELGRKSKTIDNAMQRVRRKLSRQKRSHERKQK